MLFYRKTCRETSTGSPRDTCTRGAVDYRFLSVLTKILKHPKWVLFLCCFPHSGNSCCLRQWYCLRSDIVFDSDIALQWYLPYGQVKENTATSAGSRNIILATAKISLWRSQNITCEANITAHRNPRAANPEFPFHGFWKEWFSKTRAMVDFYIVYKKYISLANIFLI